MDGVLTVPERISVLEDALPQIISADLLSERRSPPTPEEALRSRSRCLVSPQPKKEASSYDQFHRSWIGSRRTERKVSALEARELRGP